MTRRSAQPSASRGYSTFSVFSRGASERSRNSSASRSQRSTSRGDVRSGPPSVRQMPQSPPARETRLPSLQRKQSASSDVFEFAQSVRTPPSQPFCADYTKSAAGTPRTLNGGAAPLSRTMSGVSGGGFGYGSMYGGFGDGTGQTTSMSSNNIAASNSFYGGMGSFYGGFGGPSDFQASSRSGSFILPNTQASQSMYGNFHGTSENNSAYAQSGGMYASAVGDEDESEGDLLGMSAPLSSGRILRRKVSFSGVPPVVSEEEGQRTVAHVPKRVGSRRLSAQSAYEAEQSTQMPPPQQQQVQQYLPLLQQHHYPQQQQHQQQQLMTNNAATSFRGSDGGGYMRITSVSPYGNGGQNGCGSYGMTGPNYSTPFSPSTPAALAPQQQPFVHPRYNAYGAANFGTFNNGRPMMMQQQQRPMMQGYYY